MRTRTHQRGQSALEVVLWVAGAALVFGGGFVAVRWATGAERKLSPEEQAYVRSVATQQAATYLQAVATQEAERVERFLQASAEADAVKREAVRRVQSQAVAQPPASVVEAPAPPSRAAAPPPSIPATPAPSAAPPQPPPSAPTAPPPPARLLTWYDLTDYAYSIGASGTEAVCFANTMQQHFTFEQITALSIPKAAAMIQTDISKCFDSRYKPAPLPDTAPPTPTPDPFACVPC